MTAVIPVPVVNLRPFSNSLSLDFTFQLVKKGGCQDTTPINMQGSILRDSYLDLRGYPLYASLPNLEVFANAGFPFTRFADLAQTTAVLPTAPAPQEIEAFLSLMGHFGRQTGFPALRVTVTGPEALHNGAQGDFLVLGTGDDQPAFDLLAGNLPVTTRNGQLEVRDTQSFFAPAQIHFLWWKLRDDEHAQSGDLTAGGVPDAVIEGIRSPYDAGGSIVTIHLRDAAAFEPFMSAFLKVQQASDISGTVSVLHESQFQSFRIGNEIYHVGVLPPWTRARLWFMEYPWLVAVIVMGLMFLLAVWARLGLRRMARVRLSVPENQSR